MNKREKYNNEIKGGKKKLSLSEDRNILLRIEKKVEKKIFSLISKKKKKYRKKVQEKRRNKNNLKNKCIKYII